MKLAPQVKITLIITAAVLGVLWYIFIFDKDRKQRNRAKADIDDQEKQVNKGQAPTLTDADFKAMANEIQAAVDRWGTDEEALYKVIEKLVNDADAHELNKAYGIRSERSLGSWLQSDGELKGVHNKLRAKGIKYRFNIIDNSPFYDAFDKNLTEYGA